MFGDWRVASADPVVLLWLNFAGALRCIDKVQYVNDVLYAIGQVTSLDFWILTRAGAAGAVFAIFDSTIKIKAGPSKHVARVLHFPRSCEEDVSKKYYALPMVVSFSRYAEFASTFGGTY